MPRRRVHRTRFDLETFEREVLAAALAGEMVSSAVLDGLFMEIPVTARGSASWLWTQGGTRTLRTEWLLRLALAVDQTTIRGRRLAAARFALWLLTDPTYGIAWYLRHSQYFQPAATLIRLLERYRDGEQTRSSEWVTVQNQLTDAMTTGAAGYAREIARSWAKLFSGGGRKRIPSTDLYATRQLLGDQLLLPRIKIQAVLEEAFLTALTTPEKKDRGVICLLLSEQPQAG